MASTLLVRDEPPHGPYPGALQPIREAIVGADQRLDIRQGIPQIDGQPRNSVGVALTRQDNAGVGVRQMLGVEAQRIAATGIALKEPGHAMPSEIATVEKGRNKP